MNYNVSLVEAKSHFGGRINSLKIPNSRWIELGAEEIHSSSTPLFKIFKELGADLEDQYFYEDIYYDRLTRKMINERTFYKKYQNQLQVYDRLEQLKNS
jgi:monoamine oxidase